MAAASVGVAAERVREGLVVEGARMVVEVEDMVWDDL